MRRPLIRALVLLVATLMVFAAPTVLAKSDGDKGNSCPPPTPGHPESPTPGCGHGRTTTTEAPDPECLANPPGNVEVDASPIAYGCIVAYILEGEGEAVCPPGSQVIVIDDENLADVIAVCVTLGPTAP